MKIAIIGTHRVGKTTLAEELLKHLAGYQLHPEPYHQLEESGYDFSDPPQLDDFFLQFDYSLHQIQQSTGMEIFDRCPLDILAYIHATDPSRNIEMYLDSAIELLKQLDHVVLVPIEEAARIPLQ
jgi:predicted ATPase